MVREEFQISGLTENCVGRLLLLAISGLATGLTLIFPQLGLFEWVTLIPMGVVLYHLGFESQIKIKQAYGYGFYFFMSLYLVVYHWFVYMYPLEFTGMHPDAAAVVVVFAWLGLAVLASVCGGLVFVFALLFGRTSVVRKHRFLMPFVMAALWVLFEWSQTQTFAGVPWGRLALGQVELLPMIQMASVFGSYFISFLVVAVNMCLAFVLCRACRICVGVMTACALILGNFIAGSAMLAYDRDVNETLGAAVIQGNIASGDKWGTSISGIIDIYEEYTYEAATDGRVELIIWPETAIPIEFGKTFHSERLKEISIGCGKPVLVGIFVENDDGMDENSLVLLHPDGSVDSDRYAKRHLVPFGEYVPLRGLITTLIPPLTQLAMLGEDIAAGEGSALIEFNGRALGPLICFDSIYESLTLESVRDGAEIIILSTNDSWFYDSAAARMHLAQARLRAVETRRAVFRAANTGISALVDSDGRVVEYLPTLEGGYLIGELEMSSIRTPYVIWGNIFVVMAAIFVAGVFCIEGFVKSRRKI